MMFSFLQREKYECQVYHWDGSKEDQYRQFEGEILVFLKLFNKAIMFYLFSIAKQIEDDNEKGNVWRYF